MKAVIYLLTACCSIGFAAQEWDLPETVTDGERNEIRLTIFREIGDIESQQGSSGVLKYLQMLNLGTLAQAEPGESADSISGVSLSKPFFGKCALYSSEKLLRGLRLVSTIEEFRTSVALAISFSSLQTKVPDVVDWFAARSSNAR